MAAEDELMSQVFQLLQSLEMAEMPGVLGQPVLGEAEVGESGVGGSGVGEAIESDGTPLTLDFLTRKLGGFRNIGWTVEHRIDDNGARVHQALVYSLRTFATFSSTWLLDEEVALRQALLKCYESEAVEQPDNVASIAALDAPAGSESRFSVRSESLQSSCSKSLSKSETLGVEEMRLTEKTQVLVWASYLPEDKTTQELLGIWVDILASQCSIVSLYKLPLAPQGLFLFEDLPSTITFLRTVKSRQLEFFDALVAGDWSPHNSAAASVLINPESGDAVGFALVNVSTNHPTCLHTLLRLSQQDAVALGHKRSSTETLRLLLTHPEVAPLMAVPPLQPPTSFTMARTTPLSQTPSHRRAWIWCALCGSQARDIPGAWKHVSKAPHETLKVERNRWCMKWIQATHPAIAATLMQETTAILEPAETERASRFEDVTGMQFSGLQTSSPLNAARLNPHANPFIPLSPGSPPSMASPLTPPQSQAKLRKPAPKESVLKESACLSYPRDSEASFQVPFTNSLLHARKESTMRSTSLKEAPLSSEARLLSAWTSKQGLSPQQSQWHDKLANATLTEWGSDM